MNAKKKRLKRIYQKGLMNAEERVAFNSERHMEVLIKQRKQNKKLKTFRTASI